ncbi:MAG TPA: hypothetical protein VIT43_15400 [Candidatus Dormibacteraeota bacterium]
MEETPVMACTLSDVDLRDRRAAWMKVGRYATETTLIDGGVSFLFSPAPGVGESLARLADLERDCCSWMTIELRQSAAGLLMSVTGMGDDGEAAARETFGPLAELVSGRPSEPRR